MWPYGLNHQTRSRARESTTTQHACDRLYHQSGQWRARQATGRVAHAARRAQVAPRESGFAPPGGASKPPKACIGARVERCTTSVQHSTDRGLTSRCQRLFALVDPAGRGWIHVRDEKHGGLARLLHLVGIEPTPQALVRVQAEMGVAAAAPQPETRRDRERLGTGDRHSHCRSVVRQGQFLSWLRSHGRGMLQPRATASGPAFGRPSPRDQEGAHDVLQWAGSECWAWRPAKGVLPAHSFDPLQQRDVVVPRPMPIYSPPAPSAINEGACTEHLAQTGTEAGAGEGTNPKQTFAPVQADAGTALVIERYALTLSTGASHSGALDAAGASTCAERGLGARLNTSSASRARSSAQERARASLMFVAPRLASFLLLRSHLLDAARAANTPGWLNETELIDSLLRFEHLMAEAPTGLRTSGNAGDHPGCNDPRTNFYEIQLDQDIVLNRSAHAKSKSHQMHNRLAVLQRNTGGDAQKVLTKCTTRAQMRKVWLFLMENMLNGFGAQTQGQVDTVWTDGAPAKASANASALSYSRQGPRICPEPIFRVLCGHASPPVRAAARLRFEACAATMAGSAQAALNKATLRRAFVASRHPCVQMGRIGEARALADVSLALRLAGSRGASQSSLSVDEFIDMFDCISAAVCAAHLRANESSIASAEAYVLRLITGFDTGCTAAASNINSRRDNNTKSGHNASVSANAYAYQVRPGQRNQRCTVMMYHPV